jgi:hypothetical protein
MIKVMVVYEETPNGLVRKGTATFSDVEKKLLIHMQGVFFHDTFSPTLIFKEFSPTLESCNDKLD